MEGGGPRVEERRVAGRERREDGRATGEKRPTGKIWILTMVNIGLYKITTTNIVFKKLPPVILIY